MDENEPPWNCNVQVKNTDVDNQDLKKNQRNQPSKIVGWVNNS